MRESLLLHSTNIVVYPNILLFMGLHYFISFAVFVVQFSRCVLNGCLLYNRRLVGTSGFEPPTSRLSGVRSNQLSYEPIPGGDERVRTDGLLLARQALSQLSYTPVFGCDQLSRSTLQQSEDVLTPSKPYSAFDAFQRFFFSATFSFLGLHLRKEVIQPHLPIRLPCYDFTPVIDLTFDGSLLCRLGYRLRALSTPMV